MPICNTCQIGANTVEDEPFGCPFVNNLTDGECGLYVEIEEGECNG